MRSKVLLFLVFALMSVFFADLSSACSDIDQKASLHTVSQSSPSEDPHDADGDHHCPVHCVHHVLFPIPAYIQNSIQVVSQNSFGYRFSLPTSYLDGPFTPPRA